MAKKEKTVKQTYKKYRAIQYGTFGGQWLSIIAPFITIGIVNFDEYFIVNPTNGTKLSFGCGLALAVMGLAIWLNVKKTENKEITNGYITFLIGWAVATAIVWLISSILNDLFMIMAYGLIGMVVGACCNVTSASYKKKAQMYLDALQSNDIANKLEIEKATLKAKAKKERDEEIARSSVE